MRAPHRSQFPGRFAWLAAVLLLASLGGCDFLGLGGDDDGGGSGGLRSGYDTTGLYAVEPQVAACEAGALSDAFAQRFVERLNAIRASHGLSPVTLTPDPALTDAVQQAALTIVANARSGHGLDPGALCYSEAAALGRHDSLLLMAAGNQVGDVQDPDRYLADWLRDLGVGNLGHRRWLLDPFLAEVALGFVGGEASVPFEYSPIIAATLHVTSEREQSLPDGAGLGYVAYPFGLYPAALVDLEAPILSFSVVADSSARLANVDRVSFDTTQITLEDAAGHTLTVDSPVASTDLVGLPNALSWQTGPLTRGVTYTVTVSGVEVDGVLTDYVYAFTLL